MTEARIIYVTGMKPKPPPVEHRRELTRVLGAGLERACPGTAVWLDAREQNFVLVSWTCHFYDFTRDIGLDLPGIERLLAAPYPTRRDRREVEALPRRLVRLWHLVGDSFPLLTSVVASKDLKLTLAEVHRYLENRRGIAERIRAMVRDALHAAWSAGERVMLVGHSLGSVIALDALWEAASKEGGSVDYLMTLGSPLATRFIRRSVLATRQRRSAPRGEIARRWVNVTARGELVALHPRLEPFFGWMVDRGLVGSIEDDTDLLNHFRDAAGLDVHKSYGYLSDARVAGRMGEWIAEVGAAARASR